jgi:tubulin epsilon
MVALSYETMCLLRAQGHNVYGPEYADDILEKIRKQVELCDSLQSFVMLHSLGGGTGSGVGSYIVELLHDAYPQVYQFSTSIFPSVDDDVVTSPYNRYEIYITSAYADVL